MTLVLRLNGFNQVGALESQLFETQGQYQEALAQVKLEAGRVSELRAALEERQSQVKEMTVKKEEAETRLKNTAAAVEV